MKKTFRRFISLVILCMITAGFTALFSNSSFAAVELQPHQKRSVEYLLNHPNQKGLLLFHSLGSGKTYIALDYAERKPEMKVLILLPEFLKSNWTTQMKSFGVKNQGRYEMVSLEEADSILKYDLSNTIVILDEVHKLVQKIRSATLLNSEKFVSIYEKIRSANKLMLLTGTPIFGDTSDLSYVANLLSDHDEYPLDPVKFRTELTKVKPVTSLVRGQLTESKLAVLAVPFVVTLTALVTLAAGPWWAVPLAAMAGGAAIPLTNEFFPANQVSFRELNTEKWKDFAKQNISYYNVKLEENEDYPTKKVVEKKVIYNDRQTHYFLSFADEDLDISQLRRLLAEENVRYTDQYLRIQGTALQKQLLGNKFSGLEIGNFEFKESGDRIVEAPKFMEILQMIRNEPGQVAIYSNFFVNGIQKFAAFLDRQGMKDQYVLLSPSQSVATQTHILEQYNKGLKRILLIHPEITEGVSLIGTQQFHILEPIGNAALLQQIIGRAIRYRSHSHLPKDQRKVNVYLWESAVEYSKSGIPTSAALIKREHWQKNFSEVNPSMWTKGIVEIDSNYFLKDETPDSRLKRHQLSVQHDIDSLRDLLEKYSVEQGG